MLLKYFEAVYFSKINHSLMAKRYALTTENNKLLNFSKSMKIKWFCVNERTLPYNDVILIINVSQNFMNIYTYIFFYLSESLLTLHAWLSFHFFTNLVKPRIFQTYNYVVYVFT